MKINRKINSDHCYKSMWGTLIIASLCGGVLWPSDIFAATQVTGTVGVSLDLTAACSINGQVATSGSNFGSINLGSTTTLFDKTSRTAINNSNNGISVHCTYGHAPSFSVSSGVNDGKFASSHTHLLSANGVYIPYDLYLDATTSLPVLNNASVSSTSSGSDYSFVLYAQAFNPGAGVNLTEGHYTDTLNVTLSF